MSGRDKLIHFDQQGRIEHMFSSATGTTTLAFLRTFSHRASLQQRMSAFPIKSSALENISSHLRVNTCAETRCLFILDPIIVLTKLDILKAMLVLSETYSRSKGA